MGVERQQVGFALDIWCGRLGLGLLHDLVAPGRHVAVHHVVVGPAGVTVVLTERCDGEAWTGSPRAIDGLAGHVAELRATLALAGLAAVPVRGALCLVGDASGAPPAGVVAHGDLAVGAPQPVAVHAAAEGPCSLEIAGAAYGAIASTYRVRGCGRPPAPPFAGGPERPGALSRLRARFATTRA